MPIIIVPETTLDGGPEDAKVVPASVQEKRHRNAAIDRVTDD